PWIPRKLRESRLKMAAALDQELKTPMGILFEGPEDDPEIGMTAALDGLPSPHGAIITVGDVTTKTMLDMGLTPDIALIDGQTKRTELEESLKVNPQQFHHRIHAENPAGFLTPSLNQAIATALLAEETLVLEVEGEEDLAPLIIHCLAPIGTLVLYGQPKTGVVVQYTTLEVKQRCRFLISLFEVV
ncbi:MAG: GTP-dependent dephospho-CoA kinase family protein, partial [Candidatus Poseidoniales archaeon]